MKIGDSVSDGGTPRYFGVYPAIVTDITRDAERLGRIELKFPWLGEGGGDVRALATLCTPYADDDQGFEFIPAVGTQVIVAFEAGEITRPYVLGACWNGVEALPESPETANNKRLIKTRSGSLLEFDDSEGAAKVTVSMKSGHSIVMQDAGPAITVTHSGGSSITIDSSGITVTSTALVTVNASSVTVNSPVSTFSGIVTCQTLVATSVVSSSYTPGAGNVW
jgi:uncharacterized protein involved in type VI secretion and phage assembly